IQRWKIPVRNGPKIGGKVKTTLAQKTINGGADREREPKMRPLRRMSQAPCGYKIRSPSLKASQVSQIPNPPFVPCTADGRGEPDCTFIAAGNDVGFSWTVHFGQI
ncbi:hypothetical protein, partial [Ruegeria sp. HKCCD8929]|uniref:hypothetical protein n=1 Tax=Ruegeria sp. HKCCD8929 TaxID=2683006 RepID=UPI001C2C67B9